MQRAFGTLIKSLISPGDKVVAGVSGGADSIALLHLLVAVREAGSPFTLFVAHLNHGLRGALSDADADFVAGAARGLGIECAMEKCDVAAMASAQGRGVEEAARNERYAFFERFCFQRGATAVAVAHHADDQAETVLHRVLRGTGLAGLAGMPAQRPLFAGSPIRLIRPLLSFTRAQLREYLTAQNIPYRDDSSNMDNGPTRNRIRNMVLPLLEQQINPRVSEALLRLSEQARWFDEFFREQVGRTFETLAVAGTEEELILDATALARKSTLLQTGLIKEAYARLGMGEGDLTLAHLTAVSNLLGEHASGKKVELPRGIVAEKRYDRLIFRHDSTADAPPSQEGVLLRVPGKTLFPGAALEIVAEVDTAPGVAGGGTPASRLCEVLDAQSVQQPVLVRLRRPGDRFTPLGAPGSKTISDFLTDSKVPPQNRRNMAILCDQAGPIWVVGQRIADRVKLTPRTTSVLRLTARELNS